MPKTGGPKRSAEDAAEDGLGVCCGMEDDGLGVVTMRVFHGKFVRGKI